MTAGLLWQDGGADQGCSAAATCPPTHDALKVALPTGYVLSWLERAMTHTETWHVWCCPVSMPPPNPFLKVLPLCMLWAAQVPSPLLATPAPACNSSLPPHTLCTVGDPGVSACQQQLHLQARGASLAPRSWEHEGGAEQCPIHSIWGLHPPSLCTHVTNPTVHSKDQRLGRRSQL